MLAVNCVKYAIINCLNILATDSILEHFVTFLKCLLFIYKKKRRQRLYEARSSHY